MIAGRWKIFEKAGKPGWTALVPIYNTYVMIKVGGLSGWWMLLYLVPVVDVIPFIVVPIKVAEKFDKSGIYGLGLMLFPFIFLPHLGFSDARYVE